MREYSLEKAPQRHPALCFRIPTVFPSIPGTVHIHTDHPLRSHPQNGCCDSGTGHVTKLRLVADARGQFPQNSSTPVNTADLHLSLGELGKSPHIFTFISPLSCKKTQKSLEDERRCLLSCTGSLAGGCWPPGTSEPIVAQNASWALSLEMFWNCLY